MTPPRTWRDVLDEANASAQAGQPEAARALLRAHLHNWPKVPPAYHATIGRLSMRALDWPTAAHHLSLARDTMAPLVPQNLRRDLGLALIHTGRAEDAGSELDTLLAEGGSITRPAFLAAIQAHRHRTTQPNPHSLLAQAELPNEAKARDAEMALLLEARPSFTCVPAAYDAAIGRAALATGHWTLAAEHLTHARNAWPGEAPGQIHRLLGTALHHAGRHLEAGCELSQALAQAEDIPQLGLRLAINAHRAATGLGTALNTGCPRNYLLADADRALLYLAIPKNACTLLRTIFILNSPHRDAYLASKTFIHDFVPRIARDPLPQSCLTAPDVFRMVILRDPLRRLLSAYLDKFVLFRSRDDPYLGLRIARAIRDAQAMHSIPYDPRRSISFEEFVCYLAVTPDVGMDEHWLPQSVFVGNDLSRFEHVGRVEQLDRTLDILATRFGYAVERDLTLHVRNGNRHLRRYSETAQIPNPSRALPEELRALQGGGMPVPEAFATTALRALVERRYAADFAMLAAAD